MVLILSTSLNSQSKSRQLARQAEKEIKALGHSVDFVNLADYDLPFCDGGQTDQHPQVLELKEKIAKAKGILMACPVYCYDVNAVAKNLIELTGAAWREEKIVGFLLAAGGEGSWMSVMKFANSLMLDFRSVIIPRFVYASGTHFGKRGLESPEIENRIKDLSETMVRWVKAFS